jgi:hypothetical protein
MLANCCHSFLPNAGNPPILFLQIFCNIFCQTTSPLFLVAFFISIGFIPSITKLASVKCGALGTELEYVKRLRSPEIDSKDSIPLPLYTCIAWQVGTTNRVIVPARQQIASCKKNSLHILCLYRP